MKSVLRLSALMALAGSVAYAAGDPAMAVLVDFSKPGHGWHAAHHVANAVQTETGYAFDQTGGDPWCVGPLLALPHRASGAKYLRVELEVAPVKTESSFQLFWHRPKEEFVEERSFRLQPSGNPPHTVFEAVVTADQFATNALALRIDPPGRTPDMTRVEFRKLRVRYEAPEWTPTFKAPPPLSLPADALVLKGDGWQLRHDRTRMGAFALSSGEKVWAEGNPNEPFVIQGADGAPETLDWVKGRFQAQVDGEGTRIDASVTLKDASGRGWTWTRTFVRDGADLRIRTRLAADRPAQVYHVPYLTLFADRTSRGRKGQALLPGIEYLADEPSSSEKEMRGPMANRLIPSSHMLCYPMMVLTDATRWLAVEWLRPAGAVQPFGPVFDTPDRLFGSGGHLMALWAPAVGPHRRDSDTCVLTAAPFTSGEAEAVVSLGAGGAVTDALAARLPLAKFPPPPVLTAEKSCDVLARGWLDSGIREGTGCRHALGAGWKPLKASDVPALMMWLAATTPNAADAARLDTGAQAMIDSFPEGSSARQGWGTYVSHISRPAAPLVYGDPLAYSASFTRTARALARELAGGKITWKPKVAGPDDFGSTLGADHCNGLTAGRAVAMLTGATWSGDETLVTNALAVLDKMTALYGQDVPRGAQSWEMPLHTPDILASGKLVGCYVKGFILSGNPLYLERARYWAMTGLTMVYLQDPPTDVEKPIGRYATIGVMGATNWGGVNWIGRPVQWCGLVYAAALSELAEVESDPGKAALWRTLARGITASGVDQCYGADDGDKVGLLPDSFQPATQKREPVPINPGTVQENVSDFIGLPYYRVARAVPGVCRTLVHAPGRVTARSVGKDEQARIDVEGWPKRPYRVAFTRLRKPRAVTVDGKSVSFDYADGVVAVRVQPAAGAVTIVVEAAE
ncbi:MAG: hypothetical protein IJI36_19390 [Kiritimatiellae bacterium]|nr:hypothetical protein [Kiritimatiellia bacterium]